MFAQQHPIARVAEETVLNLKELETRIEVLKNDLAALCTNVGLPETARIAVTPAALLDPRAQIAQSTRQHALSGIPPSTIAPQLAPFGSFNQIGISPIGINPQAIPPVSSVPGYSPYAAVSPWSTPQGFHPYAAVSPWSSTPQAFGSYPTVSPWSTPQGFSPYAAFSPYSVGSFNPLATPYGSPFASFAGTPFGNFR